jgi:hypothetical protein
MTSQATIWRNGGMLVAALALTLAGGYVHGRLSNRRGHADSVAEAVERLNSLPEDIGPWRVVSQHSLSDTEQSILLSHAFVGRTYRHEQTGATIQLSLLLGPPGPTSVHTPEMCLGSKTFRQETPRSALQAADRDDRLWTVTFQSTDVAARRVRVVYGWRFDDEWEAARQPRISYGARPYLYKLQLLCSGDAGPTQASCTAFLTDLLPLLDDHLR